MIVRWSETAAEHLESIHSYIAQDNPDAASATIARILRAIEPLTRYPKLGHRGRDPRTRELIHVPYVIVYRVEEERQCIRIEAVLHGSRRFQ